MDKRAPGVDAVGQPQVSFDDPRPPGAAGADPTPGPGGPGTPSDSGPSSGGPPAGPSGEIDRVGLDDPQMETVVRSLAASVNLRMMDVLLRERQADPSAGWLFLSQIAEALDEKPGTVGLAVQKLLPLLEEKREKGKRYFRSRYTAMDLLLGRP